MKHIHPRINGKNIQSVYELGASFDLFAKAETGLDGDTLMQLIIQAIQTRHAEATEVPSYHPHPIWKLDTNGVHVVYQILRNRVQVFDIFSKQTGFPFAPNQDLLAEDTAKKCE